MGQGSRALLAASLAGLVACTAPTPAHAPERLTRLLPALGAPEFVTLDADTRPAIRLGPGEKKWCAFTAGPGSRLAFSIGMLPGGPRSGVVEFQVRVDGRELLRDKVPASRVRWWNRSVPIETTGEARVEFEANQALALAAPRVIPARTRRPRVLIWISQDTLRADHLESYGYGRDTAPNFERLAKAWTFFEQGVAAASWTLPSLASQLTSRYPSFHGATNHLLAADERFPTLFQTLATQGFAVAGVTGNPFVSAGHGLARGFDSLVYTGLRADVVSRLAEHCAEQWGGGDLALFVHYMDPHSPYYPPPPFDQRFGVKYSGRVDGYNYQSAARTDADREHVRALYDGEIAYTDGEIAGLLEALAAKQVMAGAVLAYTADHGEELFERGAWGHAHTLYEELIHVPFALRVPGAAGRRVAEPVSLVDLAPTLLDAFGIAAPASYQGRSLLALVRGGTLPPVSLFSETARNTVQHQVAVRDGRWKYVAVFKEGGAVRRLEREQLFDLEADPQEKSPVGRDLIPFRGEVEAFLARSRTAGAEHRVAPLRPEDEERLRALGYVN